MADPTTDPYADWHMLNRRRITCLLEWLCTCCASITRAGDHWPRPVRAVAEWVGPTGHRELLCHSCLGYWWDNARDDRELTPRSVIMLPERRR